MGFLVLFAAAGVPGCGTSSERGRAPADGFRGDASAYDSATGGSSGSTAAGSSSSGASGTTPDDSGSDRMQSGDSGAGETGTASSGGPSPSAAPPLDKLVFGDSASEAGHFLNANFSAPTDTTKIAWTGGTPAPSNPSATGPSDVVVGGMGLSSRRLLPRTPNGDVYGGQMTFTMAVDPVKQNYFTVKMWGEDHASGFLILDVNGKEIGARHGAAGLNEDPLYFLGTGWYSGRFFYRTEPLPLPMTRGKTSATITIRSLGNMFYYAPIFTYVPQYQHIMNAPSPNLYVAYTHSGAIVDTSGEVQGTAPAAPTPRMSENEASAVNGVKSNVNGALAGKLTAAANGLKPADIQFLARCYDAKGESRSELARVSGRKGGHRFNQSGGRRHRRTSDCAERQCRSRRFARGQ